MRWEDAGAWSDRGRGVRGGPSRPGRPGRGRVAEELRARIAATPDGGDTLTVSIGVARTDERRTTFTELFDAADGALYRAKAGGRNRVVAADDPVGPDEVIRDRRADPPRSATHSVPPPAVVAGGRTERPPDRGPVLHDVLEHSHLIHMTRRLRERNTLPIVAVYLAVIASIPRIGWTIIPLALMGSLAHRRAQRNVETVRNPLRTVGAGWLLTQVGIVAGLPWMHDDAVWLICLLVSMIITASAAFPLRYTVAGVTTTAVLMVGGALLIDVRVLKRRRRPSRSTSRSWPHAPSPDAASECSQPACAPSRTTTS